MMSLVPPSTVKIWMLLARQSGSLATISAVWQPKTPNVPLPSCTTLSTAPEPVGSLTEIVKPVCPQPGFVMVTPVITPPTTVAVADAPWFSVMVGLV